MSKPDRTLFVVRWEGRDGDGFLLARASGKMEAAKAACAKACPDSKAVEFDKAEFHEGTLLLFVPTECEEEDIIDADQSNGLEGSHGIYVAYVSEVRDADIVEGE